ncbi:MAG: glycerophosphodiester phosphodiesterase [bacterium]|nr:glycerophosphodiester phosphodiesterase [bacterium]
MHFRIGHRGAKAYAKENTLESFREALKLGVNALEMDVRSTKDGHMVISHDEDLQRVFRAKGNINDLTLLQIKALTKGLMPTLEEALRCIEKKGKKIERVFVELKEVGHEAKVLNIIKKTKMRAAIISFLEEALQNARKLDKRVELGFIYVRHPDPIKTALGLKASYLMPLYRFTHAKNIEKAHEKGLKVVVWTINTRKEAKEYVAKGVDGIASDKPDILKGL